MLATLHCGWPLRVPTDFPSPVEIFVDVRKHTPRSSSVFEVLYLCEPEAIFPALTAWAARNLDRFHLVVVSSDALVGRAAHVVPLEFGTCWVPPDVTPPRKRSGVSLLVGRKRRTEGHRLRHTVWARQEEIRTPKRFFRSRRGWPRRLAWLEGFPGLDLPANPWRWPTIGDSKLPLFESRFHLTIENCRSRYYFTEKILDCFLTETVPIYWGCRNIGDYFDTSGILEAGSADGLIAACNTQATDDTYAAMAPAIAENRRRAARYLDVGARLGAVVAERM